jgi:creatinine amidohydrolase
MDDCPVVYVPLGAYEFHGEHPDHAGLFERTLFSAFWPGRVHLEKLPSLAESPSPDPDGDQTGPHRHDPDHPLWGVIGQDPRTFDPGRTLQLLDAIVSRLVLDVVHGSARA